MSNPFPIHSEGPFQVGAEYSNQQDEVEDAEGRTIAVVWTRAAIPGATARPQFKDVPRLKGNLHLFAASHDLLAAARQAEVTLSAVCAADPKNYAARKGAIKLRKAIAKAEGAQ